MHYHYDVSCFLLSSAFSQTISMEALFLVDVTKVAICDEMCDDGSD